MNPFVKRKKEKFEKIFAWREGMLRMARHAECGCAIRYISVIRSLRMT